MDQEETLNGALFIFNAGHDINLDPGAVSPIRPELGDEIHTEEAEWCNKIAIMCVDKIQRMGGNAMFIQNDDLDAVCDLANSNNADVFVSIHMNSAANYNARGTETFYFENSERSKLLADKVQDKLIENTGFINRGVKPCRFYVCRHTDMPAVLVETGFVSNPSEEIIMNTDEYITQVVDAICYGAVDAYVELKG